MWRDAKMILSEVHLQSDRCNLVFRIDTIYIYMLECFSLFTKDPGVERYVYVISFTNCPRDADVDYLQSGDVRVYFNSRSSFRESFFIPRTRLRKNIMRSSNLLPTLRGIHSLLNQSKMWRDGCEKVFSLQFSKSDKVYATEKFNLPSRISAIRRSNLLPPPRVRKSLFTYKRNKSIIRRNISEASK